MNRYLLALGVPLLSYMAVYAQGTPINMVVLIQETRALASRMETPADIVTLTEQIMREIPDKLLAAIPATVITGKEMGELRDLARKRLGIELTSAEIDALKRGTIPVRIRVALQARIPDLIRSVQALEFSLKNITTVLTLLDGPLLPAITPYINRQLQIAVADAIGFAREHEGDIQAISSKLLDYTGLIKSMLNALYHLNDAQFRNKLVDLVTNLQAQSKILFDTTLKPFVLKYQGELFNQLKQFKGARFSESDAHRVKNAARLAVQVGVNQKK